jgi:hypothetical protein
MDADTIITLTLGVVAILVAVAIAVFTSRLSIRHGESRSWDRQESAGEI